MKWYNKSAASAAENRVKNNLDALDRKSFKQISDKLRAQRLEDRLRGGQPLRPSVERERPSRPVTVYSEKYVPKPRPMKPSDYGGGPIIDNKTGKPINAPKGFAGAAKAFGSSKFPSAFSKVLRLNPWLNAADLLGMIIDYLSQQPEGLPNPQRPPVLPYNYYWDYEPVPLELGAGSTWADTWGFAFNGAPKTGVYWSQGPINPSQNFPLGQLSRSQYWDRHYYNAVGALRRVVNGAATRTTSAVPNPQPQPTPAYSPISHAQNPNVARNASGIPNRGIDPTISGVEERIRNKEKARIAEQRIEVMARGLAKRQMPHARIPPDKGVRERKGMTKLAKLGIALAGALDTMSEGAELIDAIYDALPEDVKKRWEAGVKKDYSIYTTVRQGDNYGQYGMEGADWKVRAIYHNWDKIDIAQAGRNILKNHISDKIIGKYQAGMPVNIGNAVGDGEMYVAKQIDKALDYAIDSAIGVFR